MIKKCNCYDCLRKFKDDEDNTISDFCGIQVGDNRDKTIYNSKECPFYCDKFWDYELEKVITKHDDVDYISQEKDECNDKYYHGLFAGLSNTGRDLQDKRNEWENRHEYCDTVICPYCDYEFEHEDDYIPYKENEEEIKCPICHKKFNCVTEVTYSWSTSKLEEFTE
jgi:hypothetical protein